jgi:transcriptional regulator with XRE-family HTH domain
MTIMARAEPMSDEELAYNRLVGERIDHFLRLRKWTQREVEARTGIDQTLVSRYVNGLTRLSAWKIHLIAIALGVTTDDLLDPARDVTPLPAPSDYEVWTRRLLEKMSWQEAFYRLASIQGALDATARDPLEADVKAAENAIRLHRKSGNGPAS